jgi:hypothetical protein
MVAHMILGAENATARIEEMAAHPMIVPAEGFRGEYGGAYGYDLPLATLRERALSPGR